MRPILYAHPFSSYCMKVLIALYENAIAFDYRQLLPEHPEHGTELAALWPLGRFPVLVDEGQTIAESSIIIEHLGLHHPGPVRLVPADRAAALEVRMLDRIFDTHVMAAMMAIVAQHMRAEADRDPLAILQAKAGLDTVYGWLDVRLAGRTWAAGEGFSLADCAAAPSLFYADWVHPIPETLADLRSYRARLLARPSMARAVEEARPFRLLFPPGAPDRD